MAFQTVTTQPLPFGLEREKHIDTLIKTFQRQIRQDVSPVTRGLTPEMKKSEEGEDSGIETDREFKRLGKLCVLRKLTRIHITTRPELQGPRCVSRRTYSISTDQQEQLFVAVEESWCVCVQCCGPARSCSLQGFDKDEECVFLFHRPLRAEMCWLGCVLMEIRAYTPRRELIGTVQQRWSMITPYFEVRDADGILTTRIQGSFCNSRCLSDQELQVESVIGENIGRIWKRWPGYNEERNMDHEYFGLDVPEGMSLNTKVLLLAATFLLNHMFFEMS